MYSNKLVLAVLRAQKAAEAHCTSAATYHQSSSVSSFAFAQIKPGKINLSLFGRLLGALEGADHVDLVERSVGGEVDDKRKAKGKHHGEYVA